MTPKKIHIYITFILAPLLALMTGCSGGHDHDDHDGHGHGDHEGHDHSEHEGHDHGEDDHDEHDGHDHSEHQKEAGPNGGRVVDSVEPHIEFYVTADRKVQLTFLDDHNHAVSPGAQEISLIGGDRSSPTKLSLARKGNVLISNSSLPDGNNLPIVLQIKESPNSQSITERFMLNMSDCPTCDYKEYACTCAHGDGHDDHSGHKH